MGLLLRISPTTALNGPDRDRDRRAASDDENHDGDDDFADAHPMLHITRGSSPILGMRS